MDTPEKTPIASSLSKFEVLLCCWDFLLNSLHSYTDPSKPELSSRDGTKVSTNEEAGMEAGQLCDSSAELQENFDPGLSQREASLELPQTLSYDCGSPNFPAPWFIESTCTSVSIVPFVHEASEKGLSDCQVEVEGICLIEQKRETIGCDWESFISDASELLIFNSPNDSEAFRGVIEKSLDPETRFFPTFISPFP
ncbi:hypothetical protein PTKIN_Ptkin10aG0052600 [Pterospermum kingtungense]